ncbi:MFS transporter [Marinobacter sp.]|uniref:MFS transporter n=1 Tax=Marinobacter sp. TaxID=50741 RepID=UPI003A92BE31
MTQARRLFLSIFLPFAAGYFLSYVYRTVNAVISGELVADMHLSASQLGLLTSTYFIAFAFSQLPVGVLLDRFGPRRVESLLLLVAALGAMVFSRADSLLALTLGRLLIGIGVACCLMASFKAFALWFRPDQLPLLNGSLMAFGALGALVATKPVEWFLIFSDWRQLFAMLAALTLALSAVIFFVVPEQSEPPADTGLRAQLAGLKQIFRDRFFWQLAPVAAVFSGSSLAIATLWAAPWLRDIMGMDSGQVATALMVMAAGMGVGFLTLGFVLARLIRLGIRPVPVVTVLLALFLMAVAVMASGRQVPGILLFMALFGFLGSVSSAVFALLSRHFDQHLAGRANTALNLLVFLSAFILQWGIGIIIGFWEVGAGASYERTGYQAAFGLLVVLQTGMLAMLAFNHRKLED